MAEDFLVPRDVYLKSGVHIGTKFKTKYMEKFIYKTRQDKLSVFNLQEVDKRLKLAFNLLSHYEPHEILLVGRRESAWKPIKKCAELTGMTAIVGRYPPGMLTNPQLKTYREAKIVLVVDPLLDKNALNDAFSRGLPIIALCDTNNTANKVDLVVPFNNKGRNSLALFFMLLAKYYMLNKKMIKSEDEFKYTVDDFVQPL